MTEAEARIREALAAGPTPGQWFHCQPFQRAEKMRTIHGVVPAQRVDFVATEPKPVHKRIVIPMEGRESNVRSEDMAYIAACSPENIAAMLADRDEREARLTRERDEARAEVKSLRAENHNLNWALGTEGYEQMATPEEQAEHEEAVRRTDEVLDRMAAAKAEHDAKYRDAERYRWLRQMIYDDRIIVAADRMLHGEALDSAIDAALAQIEQERSEQAKERT